MLTCSIRTLVSEVNIETLFWKLCIQFIQNVQKNDLLRQNLYLLIP